MFEKTYEQKRILKSLKNYNVIIDSVAGSGKTTTNLFIAKDNPTKKILLLTYNASLKFETRNKVGELEINNLEVSEEDSGDDFEWI